MDHALTSTHDQHRPRRQIAGLALVVIAAGAEAAVLRRRGWGVGGDVVVGCRQGHLFTTLWLPAVSVTSLRLGLWRVQRCPVGHHWSLVTPVERATLTVEQAQSAATHHDIWLP